MKSEESNRKYTAHINTFIFRRPWGELMSLLPDEDAGKLIKAICAHTRGEDAYKYLADRDGLHLSAAVSAIITDIERSSKRFLSKRGILPEE